MVHRDTVGGSRATSKRKLIITAQAGICSKKTSLKGPEIHNILVDIYLLKIEKKKLIIRINFKKTP